MVNYYKKSDRLLGNASKLYNRAASGGITVNTKLSPISKPTSIAPSMFRGISDPAMQQFFQSLVTSNDGRGYLQKLAPRDAGTRATDITGAMQPFMNQFDDQVIDQALTRLGDARDATMSDIGAGASQAGAFGGSRHALLEAKANEDYMRNSGELASGLKQQSFAQALQSAMGVDQAADAYGLNYAGTMMQGEGLDLNTALGKFGAMIQGNTLNLQGDNTNINRASVEDGMKTTRDNLSFMQDQLTSSEQQFNIETMLRGAMGLSNTSDDYLNRVVGAENRMFQMGDAHRDNNQAGLDASFEQFMDMLSDPYKAIELMGKSTSTDPRLNNMTTTGRATSSGTNTQEIAPGFFDYLSLALQGAGMGVDAGIWGG